MRFHQLTARQFRRFGRAIAEQPQETAVTILKIGRFTLIVERPPLDTIPSD